MSSPSPTPAPTVSAQTGAPPAAPDAARLLSWLLHELAGPVCALEAVATDPGGLAPLQADLLRRATARLVRAIRHAHALHPPAHPR